MPHQYIPFIYVSSRKLLKQWETAEFLLRLQLDADEDYDVFSEFDEEKSQGLASKDSFTTLKFHGVRNSSGSFQYTQGYCLPKTQTHKKFLEVFKSSRCNSVKEMNHQSEKKKDGLANTDVDPLLSKDLTESDLHITSQLSVKSIKLPTSSIQRLMYYQKSTRGIILSPKEKVQPKTKVSKLGSMISSLRLTKMDPKPIVNQKVLVSDHEREKFLLTQILNYFNLTNSLIQELNELSQKPEQKPIKIEKTEKLVSLLRKLTNSIRFLCSLKPEGVAFIESMEKIKDYKQLVRSINSLLMAMITGESVCLFSKLWEHYQTLVLNLNTYGRFTSSLHAAVEEFASMLNDQKVKKSQESINSLQDLGGYKLKEHSNLPIDRKKIYYDILSLKLELQRNYKHRLRKTILNNQLNRGVGQKFISNILNEFSLKITNTQLSNIGTSNIPLATGNKPIALQAPKSPV